MTIIIKIAHSVALLRCLANQTKGADNMQAIISEPKPCFKSCKISIFEKIPNIDVRIC